MVDLSRREYLVGTVLLCEIVVKQEETNKKKYPLDSTFMVGLMGLYITSIVLKGGIIYEI